MAIEFRNALLGFNKNDVLEYVAQKDKELKRLSVTLNSRIDNLKQELEILKSEHQSCLSTIGNLTIENDNLKACIAEYEKKIDEIEDMGSKIGKLYLVSKASAKDIVDRAQENSSLVEQQTDKSLVNIENTQADLKEIAENILSASQNFVERLDSLQDSLDKTKSQISENKDSSSQISEDFAELYAKLG
ncbi:MAG: hypothetical protein E7540_04965 [Ruminococcaceae bacterium]|nr:hypothetical protein [Oscillospiraceae bacterium]